jgi:hypothetical protein
LSGGLSTAATNAASTAEIILESNNTNRMGPLSVPNHSSMGEESKRKSPATLMAEASLLSQEAAVGLSLINDNNNNDERLEPHQ